MRTRIVVNDRLMAKALEATGLKSKNEVVEAGLQALVRLKSQGAIKRFRGELPCGDDFARSRRAP